MQSFSFIPLMTSEKISEYFFRKFNISVAMATNQISILDKIHTVCRGLLQEHFCKPFVKLSAVTQK